MTPPASYSLTRPVATTTTTASEIRISAPVAYGLPSAAIPGISPRRSGERRGGRMRRGLRGSSSPPRRSIFGARLRTRWPQYGHSVTYGLTSDEQFLQTTNRSGSLTEPRIPAADRPRPGFGRRIALCRRLLDDLVHDLAQVVVRLIDDELPRSAVAAVEQVLDAVELAGRAELLGVRPDPLEHAHRELAGGHALGLRKVDELLVEAVA